MLNRARRGCPSCSGARVEGAATGASLGTAGEGEGCVGTACDGAGCRPGRWSAVVVSPEQAASDAAAATSTAVDASALRTTHLRLRGGSRKLRRFFQLTTWNFQ